MPDAAFWKRKLAAFLHDPPSKCLDIATHQQQSEQAMLAAGLGTIEERRAWDHVADHLAAAADRFPFPHYNKANLRCAFDGVRNKFRHPLSGHELEFDGPFISAELGIEGGQTTQPVIRDFGGLPENEQARASFLAHWRLWPGACQRKDWRLGFLPADTRIPDHAIWPHMQMVSAFEGCRGSSGKSRPALLKLQLGPVQEFIQAARSTRDLWSGSYLLSWLMAHGLAALALRCGPDAVVFPNLRDQPLLDLVMKREVWDRVKIGNESVGESHEAMQWSFKQTLTPNLPNVFLAVVPEEEAQELAGAVEKAIREEWDRIADSVWRACEDDGFWNLNSDLPKGESLKARWLEQVKNFLSIGWAVTPVPGSLEDMELQHQAVPAETARTHYRSVKNAAEIIRNELHHGDDRYFTREGKLNNVGLAWCLAVGLNSWELDAVRQTRHFFAKSQPASGDQRQGQHFTKDSLTGKEEAVAGGKAWAGVERKLGHRFKHEDFLSAPSLIKRLWDITYLEKDWGLERMKIRNTRSLAAGNMDADDADDELPAGDGEKYFAVLAFDGDDMGKWVAGEKTPRFSSQLAQYEGGGALEYFQRPDHRERFENFLNTPRPLSPGYHLQFSECLSNFALRCARGIVEAYQGDLIYAGGDDVVALLPADSALACARELRNAFCGGALNGNAGHGLAQKAPGYLISESYKGDGDAKIPFVVPGPKASASVGIAIAHVKSPLQDAVKAAQKAEKRAKKNDHKDAVSVTLLKRSGETVEWTARWEDGGVDAALQLLEALRNEVVSNKFPYRLGELISIYRSKVSPLVRQSSAVEGFDLEQILSLELKTVLNRQKGPTWGAGGQAFSDSFGSALSKWAAQLAAGGPDGEKLDHAISQIVALCAFCGFAKRQKIQGF